MKSIFTVSRLIIKKKFKFISETEKLQLKEYEKKYHFIKEVDYDYIQTNIDNYANIDKEKAWKSLLGKIENQNKKSFYQRVQPVFKYAAILVFFLSLTYFISVRFNLFNYSEQNLDKNAITLRLANGDTQTIISNKNKKIKTSNGNLINILKNNILICEKNSKSNELLYNELKIPFGKKFQVVLSDGTKIHLNSGSSLRFPIAFLKGQYRKVYLSGEAYFEVTKDKSHPFIVQSNAIDVKVLGTKFNVSSYNEDSTINTVLVEGSVQVFKSNNFGKKSLLVPGEKASWTKSNNRIAIDKVDVNEYTAWINGQLIFKGLPFKNIVKKLQRTYNVSIVNKNRGLDNEIFSATFNLNIDKIENIIFYLSKIHHFTYTIKNDKIIIN